MPPFGRCVAVGATAPTMSGLTLGVVSHHPGLHMFMLEDRDAGELAPSHFLQGGLHRFVRLQVSTLVQMAGIPNHRVHPVLGAGDGCSPNMVLQSIGLGRKVLSAVSIVIQWTASYVFSHSGCLQLLGQVCHRSSHGGLALIDPPQVPTGPLALAQSAQDVCLIDSDREAQPPHAGPPPWQCPSLRVSDGLGVRVAEKRQKVCERGLEGATGPTRDGGEVWPHPRT